MPGVGEGGLQGGLRRNSPSSASGWKASEDMGIATEVKYGAGEYPERTSTQGGAAGGGGGSTEFPVRPFANGDARPKASYPGQISVGGGLGGEASFG